MTLRRILTIIIILLVLVGLLFGASWFISRRNAEKNGTTPLTFREFLGIGTPAVPGQNIQGGFVSQFTTDTSADTNNNGVPDGEEDLNRNGSFDKNDIVISAQGQRADVFNNNIKSGITVSTIVFSRFGDTNANNINDWNEDVDGNGEIDGVEDKDGNEIIDGYDTGGLGTPNQNGDNGGFGDGGGLGDGGGFTSGPITPIDNFPNDAGNPGGGPGTTPTGNTSGPDIEDNSAIDPITPGTAAVDNSCTDADTNIEFTAEEVARLNTLRLRFSNIAANLYTKGDIEQQLALFDSFKTKTAQVNELITFCENTTPSLPSALQVRVPTPFYHDTSRDNNTFTGANEPTLPSRRPYLENPSVVTTLIERLLRINIW
ncbi:MAG TPA: hypothetical protein VGE18_03280 [Candidatus Paceibacterota bacterium]